MGVHSNGVDSWRIQSSWNTFLTNFPGTDEFVWGILQTGELWPPSKETKFCGDDYFKLLRAFIKLWRLTYEGSRPFFRVEIYIMDSGIVASILREVLISFRPQGNFWLCTHSLDNWTTTGEAIDNWFFRRADVSRNFRSDTSGSDFRRKHGFFAL